MFLLRLVLVWLLLAAPAAAAPLRVALLLDDDRPSPWNELLRAGLARAGVDGEVIVAAPGPGQAEIFRKAAGDHDLVIVASDSLHEVLRDNAANFRRVKFGSVDAGIRAPNIMSVTFADEQAAFLAGAAAAAVAQSLGKDTIGWLSGADTPAIRSLFGGYSEGAQLAVPGIRVIQALAQPSNASGTVAEKVAWLTESGACVIALAAGADNPAARAAAQARNIPVIEVDPEAQDVPAIVRAADRAVEEIAVAAAAGRFRGKDITIYNLENGGVDFRGADKLAARGKASRNILRRSNELGNEIKKGAIRLHSLRQRTLCDCLD